MLPEPDLKKALRAYIESGVPEGDLKELVMRLEMEIASPGDWEAAKYQHMADSEKAKISDQLV